MQWWKLPFKWTNKQRKWYCIESTEVAETLASLKSMAKLLTSKGAGFYPEFGACLEAVQQQPIFLLQLSFTVIFYFSSIDAASLALTVSQIKNRRHHWIVGKFQLVRALLQRLLYQTRIWNIDHFKFTVSFTSLILNEPVPKSVLSNWGSMVRFNQTFQG